MVAEKKPSANSLDWYRLYSDGYIEQGNLHQSDSSDFVFPVAMADTYYSILALTKVGVGEVRACSTNETRKTTTACRVYFSSSAYSGYVEVRGQSSIGPTQQAKNIIKY